MQRIWTRATVTRAKTSDCWHADGLLGLGAPGNHDHALPAMAAVIAEVAGHCLSTAFSVWAHRMTARVSDRGGHALVAQHRANLTGTGALGVTGMASAFKDAAGCGSLDLAATPADGGYRLTGTLRWASNLYPDSVMVTAAQTESGEKIVVALPLASEGVTIGNHFELLALGSTASSYLKLDNVYIGEDQILSRDIESFLNQRPPDFSGSAVGDVRRAGPPMPRRGSAQSRRRQLGVRGRIRLADNRTGRGRIAGGSFCRSRRRPGDAREA